VLLERKASIHRLVLAADGQQHTARAERAEVLLKGLERLTARIALAELDAAKAGVSDHAAPERVVEVEHQAFATAPERAGDDRGNGLRVVGGEFERDWLFGLVPEPTVVPAGDPVARGQPCRVHQVHPGRNEIAKLDVQTLNEVVGILGNSRADVPERADRQGVKVVD
jgi:hypothetical protein